MEKHYTTEDIIEGLKGIKRAEPNPFLFTRIEEKLRNSVDYKPITKLNLVAAAIAIVLLLTINLWVIFGYPKNNSPETNSYNISYFQSY
jgi:hypothetical protein